MRVTVCVRKFPVLILICLTQQQPANATSNIPDGALIEVDGSNGIVRMVEAITGSVKPQISDYSATVDES